ncbi:FadR family transcriptional regulator [Bosea sp. SSUT16]|uniref:FadR family transcriptional regulator n=1 Tax=Bosea spartocytisi TaxID=2773451 RepID=A0A927HYT9_9HYPH|nr:FCD domain-containing protein [Bosea spartocytisi]MBD3845564.1 FadR family transcriptional regulator [Bosea spartocytisi]MCT4472857.1 FCD domain-containing protein [Bosea spartocytisi]
MKQVRISDQVADYIVRLIFEEGLGPGDALPSESELARQFEVSRPAVREATNALAGRGLITVSSGRSPTVLALAQAPFANLMNHGLAIGQVRMLDVMNVRRGLEEVAAELAALNRSPEQAAELERLAAALGAARGDVETFWRLDIQFHKTLAEASGNHLLASLLAGISEVASRSTRSGLSLARNAEEWGVIIEVHLETAAGVVAGDPGRARAGMAAHFASAIGRFERALTQN